MTTDRSSDDFGRTILSRLDDLARQLEAIQEALRSDPPGQKKKLLTVREAAAEYNLSKQLLYRLKFVQARVGRAVRIRRDALDQHLNQRDLLA